MARTVADVALFLSAIAGPDPRIRCRSPRTPRASARRSARSFKGVRVAWWQGTGRHSVRAGDPARRRRAIGRCSSRLGCVVEEAEPDFAGVDDAFPTLRFARITRSTRRWFAQRPEWVKDTIKFEVARGRAADRGRCRPRAGAAGADVRPEPRVLRALRLLRPAGDAGRAVRRDDAVSDRDRRHADGDLHRLDALVLVRDVHGEPGDLGARRVHARRAAGRPADRRPPSRRLERAAAGARVRAGDPTRAAPPAL